MHAFLWLVSYSRWQCQLPSCAQVSDAGKRTVSSSHFLFSYVPPWLLPVQVLQSWIPHKKVRNDDRKEKTMFLFCFNLNFAKENSNWFMPSFPTFIWRKKVDLEILLWIVISTFLFSIFYLSQIISWHIVVSTFPSCTDRKWKKEADA